MQNSTGSLLEIVLATINKWGDQLWFKILFCIFIIITPLAAIVSPVVSNYISDKNRDMNTREVINSALSDHNNNTKDQHIKDFETAKRFYAEAKKILRDDIEKSGADYIFYIEYHNGIENVITGIPFCRFDITLQVSKENYIMLDKFKDDIVARYDILLNDDYNIPTNAYVISIDSLNIVDKYLYLQVSTLEAKEIGFISLTDDKNRIYSTLLFISKKKNTINNIELYKIRREIEELSKKNIIN
jgi:hypothetical protein